MVAWIGALTALIAATAAIAQWDIKRVLAYSTVSQLGYMVAAAGMGVYVAAIFHLLTHGVFKALLFLGSGSVIHGTHETQDMRKMGGLKGAMPHTFYTYLVGALALAGIFPLAGFWSKDEIVAAAWKGGQAPIFFILFLSSLITAFYMGRQVALVFYGNQRDTHYHAHESPNVMTWPLIALAVGALLVGFINIPFLGHLLHDWLHPVFPGEELAQFNIPIAIAATLLGLGSGYVGWKFYVDRASRIKVNGQDPLYRGMGDIWDIFAQAWLLDKFYYRTIVPWYQGAAGFLARLRSERYRRHCEWRREGFHTAGLGVALPSDRLCA
jgi:NADH-quinone oxidoreductase subunit L